MSAQTDILAGIDTDSLEKKDGKWQFRLDGRTDPDDECQRSEQDWADYGEWLNQQEEENGRSY